MPSAVERTLKNTPARKTAKSGHSPTRSRRPFPSASSLPSARRLDVLEAGGMSLHRLGAHNRLHRPVRAAIRFPARPTAFADSAATHASRYTDEKLLLAKARLVRQPPRNSHVFT